MRPTASRTAPGEAVPGGLLFGREPQLVAQCVQAGFGVFHHGAAMPLAPHHHTPAHGGGIGATRSAPINLDAIVGADIDDDLHRCPVPPVAVVPPPHRPGAVVVVVIIIIILVGGVPLDRSIMPMPPILPPGSPIIAWPPGPRGAAVPDGAGACDGACWAATW